MPLSNPTTPVLVSLTGNDIIVVIETTDSVQDFYALFVQLEESDRAVSETWSILGPELRVPVDSNNQSEFKIEDILKAEFTTHITKPMTSGLFAKVKHYVRKYRYKYYEKYGTSQTKYNESTSGSYYAVQGGIGHLTENKYSSWWAMLTSKKIFLNDMPQNKVTNEVIGELFREKLFWYNYSSVLNPSLLMKVYFLDKEPETTALLQITSEQHEIYEIEASYVKLGIIDPNAYAYELWVDIAGYDASIHQLFVIDRKYHRRTKYFLYNNKYQLTENVIFTGKFSEESEYTKQQSINLGTQESSEYNISEEIPREADSGLISIEWKNHLREFFLALKKFEIINYVVDNSYNMVPILFDSKKLPLSESEENLFNTNIKYRFAFSSYFTDNILFNLGELTAPTTKSYDQPTTGSTGIVEGSTGILTLYGICYPGPGDIKLLEPYSNTIIGTNVASSLWLINNKGAYANGFTYVTYVDFNTDTRNIIRYNHSTNAWESPIVLATTSFVGGGNTDNEDYGHASPSVMIDSDGYINVSYGGRKQGTLYNIKSASPNDIGSWNSEVLIRSGSINVAYAKLLEIDGDYVLFYRRFNGADFVLSRKVSTDNGSTWGSEIDINDFYPYYCVEVDNNNRVHISWHYYDGSINRDVYYTYCDDIKSASPTFYDTAGNAQTLPLTFVDCLIFDSAISWESNYILGMDIDENNRPHIVSLATDSVKTDKLLHFTNRFGSEWIEDVILENNNISNDSPSYGREPVEGDIYCDSNGDITCIFQFKDIKFEIVEYKSTNNGMTWFSNRNITLGSSLNNSNPFYIRNKNIIDVIWFYGDNNYGAGRNLRYHKSDAAAIKIIAAKDCEFVRDEDNDETKVSFIISNTIVSQSIEVEINQNAFINKNNINFKKTIGDWTFTMES